MKKQFTILLILIFVIGLTIISLNNSAVVLADECPDITIGSIAWSFRPGEGRAVNGSGFNEGLTVKFNNGKLDGTVSFINTMRIGATPSFSYSEPLRAGNLILTNSCGKTATYAYETYPVPQITSINIVKEYEYTYNFGCNINDIDSDSKIYPANKIRMSGLNLSVSSYAREIIKVYLNGKFIFSPSNIYHEIGEPCMDFWLPQDAPIGSNYIEVSNENRMQSDKFYFEVSKHNCVASDWKCNSWNTCNVDGTQTRECSLVSNCENPETVKPNQTQSCIPECREDKWKCGEWNSCSVNGQQTRICIKEYDCPLIENNKLEMERSCVYVPPYTPPPQPTCNADTWTCGEWSTCSLSGIQNRSCNKTFDCSTAETAPPITTQFCEAPNRPQQTPPSESEEITNQDAIIKSTVKLLCPVDAYKASQGSGTIIDSSGTILTNKHVIAGTSGCLIGFIDNFSDEPYFGERQIADIVKVSPTQDMAILKMRNPKNKTLTSVDITKGSSNLSLGTKVTTYGYPAKFGTKITYTSGDFSGTDGNYLKTTAILEYGNSGGGAYLKNGTFIGIPSAVVKGELNALGYILSINTIKAWLGNSTVAYGDINNNYSRVSVLEDIDLNKLGSLKLFIPDTDAKGDLVATPTNQNSQKTTKQPQVAQQNEPQEESVVVESDNSDKKVAGQNTTSTTEEQKPKMSWLKRLFSWLANLFNKLATK